MSSSEGVAGFLGVVVVILLIVGLMALTPFLFMLAWNYVMPGLFNLPEIGFWQSFAITFMVGILTRGFSASSKSE
jgi:hypothetical protein